MPATILTSLLALSPAAARAPDTPDATPPRFYGLEVGAGDVEASQRFYTGALGFRVESSYPGRGGAVLVNGPLRVVIVPRPAGAGPPLPAGAPTETWGGPYLNVAVEDLDVAAARVELAGGRILGDPKPNAIGRALEIVDPGGHPLHLMELARDHGGHRGEPAVFNVGFRSRDLAAAEQAWGALGFEVSTRAYLPTILPLSREGCASLVVHLTEDETRSTGRMLLGADDLAAADAWAAGLALRTGSEAPRGGPAGRTLDVALLDGRPGRLVERSPARRAFERLRSLAGDWSGSSTKGWEARAEIRVIAAGSVVCARTYFAAHPDDTMLTLWHMDGGDLLLAHYCVAQNQPRLAAESFTTGDDGEVTGVAFAWRDATGIASRDEGHMDACRMGFEKDAYASRWSWYQDGGTSWMEDIRYRRVD